MSTSPAGILEAIWIERARRRRSSALVLLIGALSLLLSGPNDALAQAAGERADERARPECFRFSFGPWSPPLDWREAGHAGDGPEAARAAADGLAAAAPPARDLAAWSGAGADTVLILFPTWWPVGIVVRLEHGNFRGDTVRGTASAFVADGRAVVPRSEVTATPRDCSS
ncbi:MAG TPA: hypothetical protein VMM18_15525 [Gemmatimonadaceae bacterium]|nr:hypothetical protein [Gemmatimonadaceae bacterium]